MQDVYVRDKIAPPVVDSDDEEEPIENKVDVEVQYEDEGPSADAVPGSLEECFFAVLSTLRRC